MIYGQGGTTTGYNTHYTGTNGYFSMLLASTRPTNKLLALRKDVFDISKITVVGSPTITSDGVASGFTKDNYLSILPIVQLGNYDNWELVSPKFTTSNTINGVSQAVFWATYNTWHGGIRIGITSNGKLYTQLASQANTDNDILVFNSVNAMPNTTYQMKIKFTGSQYIVWYKVNNADWLEYGSVETSTKVYNTWTEMFIGNISNWSFLGSIDLNAFKIYVDNQLVFQPVKPTYLLERRKEGYDPSKFTVVGTPTITEDGIINTNNTSLTGVSVNNSILVTANSWEVQSPKVVFNDITRIRNAVFGTSQNGYDGIAIFADTTRIKWNIASGANSGVFDVYVPNFSIQLGKSYIFKVTWDGNVYKLFVSIDEQGFEQIDSYNSTTKIYTSGKQAFFYKTTNKDWALDGYADLKYIKTTVDGKEVFTGAKENYYMLRR